MTRRGPRDTIRVNTRGALMLLTIKDETAGGKVTNSLTLDVLDETITVRELIRSRVYQTLIRSTQGTV